MRFIYKTSSGDGCAMLDQPGNLGFKFYPLCRSAYLCTHGRLMMHVYPAVHICINLQQGRRGRTKKAGQSNSRDTVCHKNNALLSFCFTCARATGLLHVNQKSLHLS